MNTGVWSQKFDLNKHLLKFYFFFLKRNTIILFCESPVPYHLAIPVYKVPYFRDFIILNLKLNLKSKNQCFILKGVYLFTSQASQASQAYCTSFPHTQQDLLRPQA